MSTEPATTDGTTNETPAVTPVDGFLLGGEIRLLCGGGHEMKYPFEITDPLGEDKADEIFSEDVGCPGCSTPTAPVALPVLIATGKHVDLVEGLMDADERAIELGIKGGVFELLQHLEDHVKSLAAAAVPTPAPAVESTPGPTAPVTNPEGGGSAAPAA